MILYIKMSWNTSIQINRLANEFENKTTFSALDVTGDAQVEGNVTLNSNLDVDNIITTDVTALTSLTIPNYNNGNIPDINTMGLGSIIYNTSINKYVGVGNDYIFTSVTIDSTNNILKTSSDIRYIAQATYTELNTFVAAIQNALTGLIDTRISTVNHKFTFISLTGGWEKLVFNTNIPNNNAAAAILGFNINSSTNISPDTWAYAPNITSIYQYGKKYIEFSSSNLPPSSYWVSGPNNSIINGNIGGAVGINIAHISSNASLITESLNIQDLSNGFLKSINSGDITSVSSVKISELAIDSNLNLDTFKFQSEAEPFYDNDIPNKLYVDLADFTKWSKSGDVVTQNSYLGTLSNYDLSITRNATDKIILKPSSVEFHDIIDAKNHAIITSYNAVDNHDVTNKEYVDGLVSTKFNVSGGTMTGSLYVNTIDSTNNNFNLGNNAVKINIGCGGNAQTVNIGADSTTGFTTINIGGSGDTVNIAGTLNYNNVTDLYIKDKLMTVNSSSVGSGTARGCGFQIRDNNDDNAGYIATSSNGAYFDIKAPENIYKLSTPTLSSNATIATTADISGLSSIYGTISNLNSLSGASAFKSDISGLSSIYGTISNLNSLSGASAFKSDISGLSSIYFKQTGGTILGDVNIDGTGKSLLLSNSTMPNPNNTGNNITTGNLRMGYGAYNAGIYSYNTPGNYVDVQNLGFYTPTTFNSTQTTERMTITSQNGYVGIGTTNPSCILNTQSDNNLNIIFATSLGNAYNTPTLSFYRDGVTASGTTYWSMGTRGNYDLRLYTNDLPGTPTITLQKSTYNVGIGTTDPHVKLDVAGQTSICNAGGTNYDQNLRLPQANNEYSSIIMGCAQGSTSGVGEDVWSIHRSDAYYGKVFQLRHNGIIRSVWDKTGIYTNYGDINISGTYKYNGTSIGRTVAIGCIKWSGSSWYIDTNFQNWGISSITSNSATNFYIVLNQAYPTPFPVPFMQSNTGANSPTWRISGFYNGGYAGNYYSCTVSNTPFQWDGVFFEARL